MFSGRAYRVGLRLLSVRVRRAVLLAVLVVAALPAGSALADTTIGQVGATGGVGCGAGAFGDTNYVVPSAGRFIASFSFQSVSGNANDPLDFLVLRPAGGTTYEVIGRSGVVALAEPAGLRRSSPRPRSRSGGATSSAGGRRQISVTVFALPSAGARLAVRSGGTKRPIRPWASRCPSPVARWLPSSTSSSRRTSRSRSRRSWISATTAAGSALSTTRGSRSKTRAIA